MRMSRQRGWIWTVGALLMAAAISLQGQVGPGDERLTAAVSAHIQADESINASAIQVRVQDGIALLEGSTSALAGKRRAEELAEAVPGIRSVSNRIEVQARPGWSDQRIRAQVVQALATCRTFPPEGEIG